MWRMLVAALLALACPSGARALEGELDTDDRFSAVVRLSATNMSCTGVVIDRRLILTAAHCLVDGSGKIKSVNVHFTDQDGTKRIVPSREVFVRGSFQVDQAQLQRDAAAAKLTGNRPDTRLINRRYARSVSMDLGVIVPEDDVLVRQAVRTVIDPPPLERLSHQPAIPSPRTTKRAIVVGFGQHDCLASFDGPGCRGDLQRRTSETAVWAHTIPIDDGQKSIIVFIGEKKDDGKLFSPTRHGDSGGPIFLIRPEHDDLLLIAIQSAGNLHQGIASSLAINAHFIRSVRAGETYLRAMAETGAGAIAAISVRGSKPRIGIAWSRADSTPKAEKRALAQCRKMAKADCKVVAVHRRGCRFVATGSGNGKMGWLVGESVEDAYARCKKQGIRCKKPIGGCLQ